MAVYKIDGQGNLGRLMMSGRPQAGNDGCMMMVITMIII